MPGGADSGEGRAFTRFERALEAVLAISHADGRDACAASSLVAKPIIDPQSQHPTSALST